MTFAEKLKYVREKLFLSQEALAKELGVSFATVNRWENGKHEPGYPAKKAFHLYCEKQSIKIEDK